MAITATDLGGASPTGSNPAVSVTFNTTAATSAGDKIIVDVQIRDDAPTSLACTFDSQTMTRDATVSRTSATEGTIVRFWYDDTVGRLSGKAVTATWANNSTVPGGGASIGAVKVSGLATGAPDVAGTGANGAAATGITTNASGSPTSSTDDYIALASLSINGNVTAAAAYTAGNSYTALAEEFNATRGITLIRAYKVFTAAVSAQTETWSTAAGARSWVSFISMYKAPATGGATQTISPTGIASTAALGSPSLSSIYTISPTGLSSTATLGAPTLTPGAVSISPTAIASTASIGAPSVSSLYTISPTAIGSTAALGAPTLAPGAVAISPTAIGSTAAIGAPAVGGFLTISPTGIDSTATLGAPSLSSIYTLSPTGIASTAALGAPTLGGLYTVSPAGISNNNSFGTPTFSGASSQTIHPTSIINGGAGGAGGTTYPLWVEDTDGDRYRRVAGNRYEKV